MFYNEISIGEIITSDDFDGSYFTETEPTLKLRGTVCFMSPEVRQAFLKNVPFKGDFIKSDVYSLGLTFYQAS